MILGFKTKNDKKREKALEDIFKNLSDMQSDMREFKMDMCLLNIQRCAGERMDKIGEDGE